MKNLAIKIINKKTKSEKTGRPSTGVKSKN